MMEEKRMSKFKLNMLRNSGESFMPRRAIFYPTLSCNLKCEMCFQKKHNRKEKNLTLDEIKQIFDDIELESILLVGGEIFIRRDLMQIVRYFCSRYPNVVLQTNGTLLTNKIIEELNQLEQVKDIWISIDGMKETHEKIRGTKTFDKTVNAIRALVKQKKVCINTVIMESNLDDLQEIYDFFNYEGVEAVNFQFQMTYSKKEYQESVSHLNKNGLVIDLFDDCVSEEKRNENTLEKKSKMVISTLKNCEQKTRIYFYPEIFEKKTEAYFKGDIFDSGTVLCKDLLDSVLKINQRGELMLCEVMNISFGDLKEQSLSELWNGSKIKEYRKKLTNNKMMRLCSRCCCIHKIGE